MNSKPEASVSEELTAIRKNLGFYKFYFEENMGKLIFCLPSSLRPQARASQQSGRTLGKYP